MRLCTQMSMSAISREIAEPDSSLWRVFKHHTFQGIEALIGLSTTIRVGVEDILPIHKKYMIGFLLKKHYMKQ